MTTSYSNVSSAAKLSLDIAAIDRASTGSGQAFQITLTANATLTESAEIAAINLKGADTLTIVGKNAKLNGGGAYRGLFVYAGKVTVENLAIDDTLALGGAGGSGGLGGGGGGAGLGGGLFVGAAGDVTLQGLTFTADSAIGGAGGAMGADGGGGGGGGLGGLGGRGNGVGAGGGGGGVGLTAIGGAGSAGAGGGGNGGAGLIPGAAGASGADFGGLGGSSGGGGGGGANFSGEYGDNGAGGGAGGLSAGGGGFGGGGGGEGSYTKGAGGYDPLAGYGGGGGGGGGSGGFGGGAGFDGEPGFGGGGAGTSGSGGGGLGAGGDIFVQAGGALTIDGGSLTAGTVEGGAGGAGGGSGEQFGGSIFLQGGQDVVFAPGAGKSQTVGGVIADLDASGGASGSVGAGSLTLDGPGQLVLDAANTFTGGVSIVEGALALDSYSAAGSGVIQFDSTLDASLVIAAGVDLNNQVTGFATGDLLDFLGAGLANLAGLVGGGTVTFAAAGDDKVEATGSSRLAASFAGFKAGDEIDFATATYGSGDYATFRGGGSGGVVDIDDLAGALVASFDVATEFQASQFVVSSVTAGAGADQVLVSGGGPRVAHHTIDDFNGDGRSDILWADSKTGGYVDWSIVGGKKKASYSIGKQTPGGGERLVGVGDFTDNGTSDLLWRNATTGEISIWDLRAGKYNNTHQIGAETPSAGWSIAGVGDFNGDGTSDILWWNHSTGQAMDWTVRDNRRISTKTFSGPGADWRVIGVGDFNGDGVSDILWRDSATGKMRDWQMANGAIEASHVLAAPSAGWTYVGDGDFAGHGADDIVFESAKGALMAWNMVDGAHSGNLQLGAVAPKGFTVASIGDFNGDGIADVGIYDKTTGVYEVGLANASGHIGGWTVVGSLSPSSWREAA